MCNVLLRDTQQKVVGPNKLAKLYPPPPSKPSRRP